MKQFIPHQSVYGQISIKYGNSFFVHKVIVLKIMLLISIYNLYGVTYYSINNGDPQDLINWNSQINGTGSTPANFTTSGDVFVIQVGTTMKQVADWIIGTGDVGNIVTLQIDGNIDLDRCNLEIKPYSIVFFNSTNQLLFNNGTKKSFILRANATFKTVNPNGISGVNCSLPNSIKLILTLESGANFEFNAIGSQATLGIPAVVNNLTVSNTSGAVTLASACTISNLTIKPNGKLTLASGNLNVATLNIQSDATGTGTYLTTGTGTISATTVNAGQYLCKDRNWYISSPVKNATTSVFNGITNSVVSYNEVSASWVPENITSMIPMKGYIAVTPSQNGVVSFAGVLNSGTMSIDLTRTSGSSKQGFNLVGNPYLSYVNWDMAVKTNLETTMWYRTKCTSGSFVFDTYGATAGVGTNLNGLGAVTKCIPPMQAFWVKVKDGQTTGKLQFDNSMQAHQDLVTNKFRAPSVYASDQKLLRLKVTNGVNNDEAIVLFNPNAKDEYDEYDSQKMTNANPIIPEVYTLAENKQVVINGFNELKFNSEIPLGFTTGQSNSFAIEAIEMSNFDVGTKVFIVDNLLNIEKEISMNDPYRFTSDIYSSTNRFSLVFRSVDVTTEDYNRAGEQNVEVKEMENGKIEINCLDGIDNQSSVSVYNLAGQMVSSSHIISEKSLISAPDKTGIYIIKVLNAGKYVTKKMMFN